MRHRVSSVEDAALYCVFLSKQTRIKNKDQRKTTSTRVRFGRKSPHKYSSEQLGLFFQQCQYCFISPYGNARSHSSLK